MLFIKCAMFLLLLAVPTTKTKTDKLVLLGITATWCPACPQQKEIWRNAHLEKIARAKNIRGMLVDIDQRPDWKPHVRILPTLLVVRVNSKNRAHVIRRLEGLQSVETTAAFLRSLPSNPR